VLLKAGLPSSTCMRHKQARNMHQARVPSWCTWVRGPACHQAEAAAAFESWSATRHLS
jgi:hypothetical protein